MWALLQYLILSLIVIASSHYIYISLNDFFSKDESVEVPFIINKKKEEESKQEIFKHMREEEAEADELTRYVKDKIKVLNIPDTDSNK
jgi:hypothetical protein